MKKLPIGIDSFEKISRNDFYYVDKTAYMVRVSKVNTSFSLVDSYVR